MYSKTSFVLSFQFVKKFRKSVCHFQQTELQEMFALVVVIGIGIDGVTFGLLRFLVGNGQVACTFLCQGALLVEAIAP